MSPISLYPGAGSLRKADAAAVCLHQPAGLCAGQEGPQDDQQPVLLPGREQCG